MERSVASDVSLADLSFLATLARSARPADRQLWLRVAVDYLLARPLAPPARGGDLAATLAEALRDVDDATRCEVARKLADCPAAADVLAAIESLGGKAALVVLQEATALPRERLLAAAAGDNARAGAVARRGDLDAELIERLADHEENEVLLALARNRRATIGPRAYAALARRARQRVESGLDSRLATALLERAPAGLEQAALFLEADSSRRAAIIGAARRAALGGPRNLKRRRDAAPTIARLERFALAGEPERFAEALADALACSRSLAKRIARDASGEPLAVALAALGAPADVAVRILTSRDLEDGADYRRLGALARLRDALDPAAADLVIAAIVGELAPPRRASRPAAAASPVAPRPSIKEAELAPRVLRRRRAFAFAFARANGDGAA